MPLPDNYVQAIDRTKFEFEQKKWSCLRGEWRLGGWWCYYLYALGIKVPLGTWGLILLAILVSLRLAGYSASWRDELLLAAPLLVILTFVSSQTGYSHHLRYVLPTFPFAFIWMSKVARAVDLKNRKIAVLAGGALLWSVASGLWVYPHSLSYFNELVDVLHHTRDPMVMLKEARRVARNRRPRGGQSCCSMAGDRCFLWHNAREHPTLRRCPSRAACGDRSRRGGVDCTSERRAPRGPVASTAT